MAATNKKLEELVGTEQFREDLYYRLNVVGILISPLRERKEDIPFLVDYFMRQYGKNRTLRIADSSLKILMEYDWPGNIRELENTIERAIVISRDGIITPDLLQPIRMKINTMPAEDVESVQPD